MTIINDLNSKNLCFSTANFSVRLLAAADQALYQSLFCNQQVMQWIGEPLTEVQVNASFAAALKHNNSAVTELAHSSRLFLVIEDPPSDVKQGLMAVTFNAINASPWSGCFDAEIGIMLLPFAQRLGLANAAFAGLCQKLQRVAIVNDIVCNIATNNLAVKKLVTALGFVYCKQGNCYKLQNNN
ncbi:GNAT family N-acetyltransferase [Arsukibacterium sp.]|uniref:GNAT family N-acetyltransferase n=1 Tax=Arsukibacterium sp. TaxID=1977258 RepID=UPI001BD497B9|nr:GNAT family N-acetyltransferase [Arsukibacterium sp.]